jgi:hypothetical protein
MSTNSSPSDRRKPLEAEEPASAPADRFPRVRARTGLRIAARITVIAVTLGLAGLGGILATGSGASYAGQVASQSRDAAPFDRVATR